MEKFCGRILKITAIVNWIERLDFDRVKPFKLWDYYYLKCCCIKIKKE